MHIVDPITCHENARNIVPHRWIDLTVKDAYLWVRWRVAIAILARIDVYDQSVDGTEGHLLITLNRLNVRNTVYQRIASLRNDVAVQSARERGLLVSTQAASDANRARCRIRGLGRIAYRECDDDRPSAVITLSVAMAWICLERFIVVSEAADRS